MTFYYHHYYLYDIFLHFGPKYIWFIALNLMLGSSKVCATMFTNSYNSWNIAQKKMMDQCNITQAFHLDWIVYEVNYDGFLLGNKFSQNMVFCNIVLSFRNAFFVLLERKLFLIVKESQRSRICIQWESKRWTVY